MTLRKSIAVLLLTSVAGMGLASARPAFAEDRPAPPEGRRVFFGELHLHTALSLDAWSYGTKLLPDDAFRFGRGDPVKVPAFQVSKEQGGSGEVIAKRAWPLDFMAVTDHSESIGTLHVLDDPNSEFAKSDFGKKVFANPGAAVIANAVAKYRHQPVPPNLADPAAMSRAWSTVIKAANDNYRPGKFTTFIAYEWSSIPGGKNLHRNVIFNADHAPAPFSADDSNRPEDLWSYLESVRKQGIDVIAIPHNGNASGGMMYDWNMSDGRPIDEAYAQRRATNEPLTEIVQIKGQSDTLPSLSPNDEFANFEIFDHLLYPATTKSPGPGSYVRDALGRGLAIQSKVGANPFKYGLVGASDIHNGLSNSDESGFAGGQFGIDPKTMLPQRDNAKRALGMLMPPAGNPEVNRALHQAIPADGDGDGAPPPSGQAGSDANRISLLERSSAGLTGVWAEDNTRDSIFAALKRKETFATSGTRIRVRVFGGWGFDKALLGKRDWVRQAYASGVPMGADLPVKPGQASAPTFILQAAKDPDGANLDRIQIIKLWLNGDAYGERIFDVALSGGRKADAQGTVSPVKNTVDLTTGKYENSTGVPMFSAVWRDPEFDASKPAVYYVRVLEIPTPRWSTLLAIKNQLPIPKEVAATIQERAWSSPIWYTPG